MREVGPCLFCLSVGWDKCTADSKVCCFCGQPLEPMAGRRSGWFRCCHGHMCLHSRYRGHLATTKDHSCYVVIPLPMSSDSIRLIANTPVLTTTPYECQRSGEQTDPLQTSDPWLSFYSGPGSQQALRDALWGTYGPTTTQLAAMPRTLNLPQSCSHVGDRLPLGGVLTGGQDQLGAPVQQEGGQQFQQPSFVPGQGVSGQNDSGHGVTFGLPPGWDQNVPTVGADGLPFSGPSRSPPVDPLLTGLMNQQLQLGQAMMEVLRRQQQTQPQQQAQQQQPQVGVQDRERLACNGHQVDTSNAHAFVQAVGEQVWRTFRVQRLG